MKILAFIRLHQEMILSKKKSKATQIYNYVRIALYSLPFIFFAIIIIYDINISGVRTYHYDLRTDVPSISKLFPAHRLDKISGGRQQVKASPIYFTTRMPHRYREAIVEVEVINPLDLTWQLGLEVVGDEDWNYFVLDPVDGVAKFNLSDAIVKNKEIRILINVDDLTSDSVFAIGEVIVTLLRPNLLEILSDKL